MPATRLLRPHLFWLLLLPACARPDASASPQAALREAELCGVAFGYPAAGWELRRVGPDTACTVELAPSGVVEGTERDRASLRVRVVASDFAAAAREAGFETRPGGDWIVRGRHEMESEAETVEVRRGRAVRGTPEIGWFPDDRGPYQGLIANPRAVVGDGGRAVFLEGGPASEPLLDAVLRSIALP